MIIKASNFVSSRRQFLKNVLPAGTLFCLGCSNLLTMPNSVDKQAGSAKKHKFFENSDFTYKDVYNFAFKNWFIPINKKLAEEVGREKFIEMLKKASSKIGAEGGRRLAESLPKNDFNSFVVDLRSTLEESSFWKHVLSYEIVEESEKLYEVKFTECLWAQTFREADASDIGYAAVCNQDYSYARAYNPKMRMIRPQTLMKGEDLCHFRWIWEG